MKRDLLEYIQAAVKRIMVWQDAELPLTTSCAAEFQTFYDMGFRDGYEAGIERYGHKQYPLQRSDDD